MTRRSSQEQYQRDFRSLTLHPQSTTAEKVLALWDLDATVKFLLRKAAAERYSGNFSLLDAALDALKVDRWQGAGPQNRALPHASDLPSRYPVIAFINEMAQAAREREPELMPEGAVLPDELMALLRGLWQQQVVMRSERHSA